MRRVYVCGMCVCLLRVSVYYEGIFVPCEYVVCVYVDFVGLRVLYLCVLAEGVGLPCMYVCFDYVAYVVFDVVNILCVYVLRVSK